MTQLGMLKSLLGINSNDKDEILGFIIAKASDMVCNYCRLKTVPAGLERVMLNMCVDLYRTECLGQEQAGGPIRGITEGKVSVTFASATNSAEDEAMAFLRNYITQLNRYRKVGW